MSAGRFGSYFKSKLPSKGDIRDFAVVFGTVYLFTNYVVGFTVCVGPSMIPTIDPRGELAFINRLSYKVAGRKYKTNDVVISKSMDDPHKRKSIRQTGHLTVCKRIGGVAGDIVVYRNKAGHPIIVKVPEEHVWLLGDNPSNSNDSRYYGPVPVSLLQGRVFAKIGTEPVFHACDIDKVFEVKELPDKTKAGENKVEVEVKEKAKGVLLSTEEATSAAQLTESGSKGAKMEEKVEKEEEKEKVKAN